MRRLSIILVLSLCIPLLAEPAAPLTTLARMPVREVTVFKDGHALLLHSGKMPTDPAGNVVLDALPSPVLGTFWPYSVEKDVKLVSVTASSRKVKVERTALSIRELIEANLGAAVNITEMPLTTGPGANTITYPASILSIPTQSGEELEATSPPNTGERLPSKGAVVLLKTEKGIKAVAMDRIVDLTFDKEPKTAVANEEFRNLLTLRLNWGEKARAKEAEVGMLYLQRGIRWIPQYKVTIDGKGKAEVKLQATLVNELTDFENSTVHLVVGVPSFAFKEMSDPIGLQQAAAQLSAQLVNAGQLGNNWDNNSQIALSNGMMTQVAAVNRHPVAQPGGGGGDLGPEIASQGKTEDLFLFTVKNVSLKKGQRMVITVAQYAVDYKDLYTLDIPVAPPAEVFRSFPDARKTEIARLLAAPKVMHNIRLTNKSEAPFTTAPALIVLNDRVLAQGMMTYTSPGASVDLTLTATVDVTVRKTDQETARTPRSERWNGDDYMKIDCTGKIVLTNYTKGALEVEVVRNFMGNFASADKDAKTQTLNHLEDASYLPAGSALPAWHSWYSWPYWWHRFNGIGRITWNLTLEPGKPAELNYGWNYYWR